jgi:DNA-binding response OmpR family regulator
LQPPNQTTYEATPQPQILIVEDEALVTLEEVDLVRGLGYEVVGPVGYLDDALRIVATDTIDAAVLDIHLTGFSVAAELNHRGVPFLFVTAADRGEVTSLFPRARVVHKPFDRDVLRTAISDMVAEH